DPEPPEDMPLPEQMVEAPPLLEPPPAPVAEAKPPIADEVSTTEMAKVADAKASSAPLLADDAAPPKPAMSEAKHSQPNSSGPVLAEASGAAVAAPVPVAAERPATSPYSRRNATDRLHWAEQQGGSRQTEAAVNAALEWLGKSQSPDGRWDASQFGAGVEM